RAHFMAGGAPRETSRSSAISTGSASRSATAKVVRPLPPDVRKDKEDPVPDERGPRPQRMLAPPSGRYWSRGPTQSTRSDDHSKLLRAQFGWRADKDGLKPMKPCAGPRRQG